MIFPIATSWRLYWMFYNAAWHDLPYVLMLIPFAYIVCYTLYSTYKTCRSQYKLKQSHTNINENEEEIPHRVLFPNEYEPLNQIS